MALPLEVVYMSGIQAFATNATMCACGYPRGDWCGVRVVSPPRDDGTSFRARYPVLRPVTQTGLQACQTTDVDGSFRFVEVAAFASFAAWLALVLGTAIRALWRRRRKN